MSASLTEAQVRERSKTVIRRIGWRMVAVGDRLTLRRKVMGRKPGEPLIRITEAEIVAIDREPLDTISSEDLAAEGFPQMTPCEFVKVFCNSHKGCRPDSTVTRIQWRYLDDEPATRRIASVAKPAADHELDEAHGRTVKYNGHLDGEIGDQHPGRLPLANMNDAETQTGQEL
ncbi:hypothetical protein H0264_18615 [Nocardia huaxiensis]|uniref:ASCH domain-containing protein n=1 Tax=Nocardia huaxiensis TaxID=2755382 RepID=A0A7D6VF23_9NOCA|nr:hypothetical protein [Nocardia huaxiensis]QLY33974.1 hypothetical protein H0264_18615 [Nocardia huaxiensis]